MTLAQAFLAQAREDMRTFHLACQSNLAWSQRLHLLQMALEKTGKAYLAANGNCMEELAKSHRAFVKFLRLLPRACPANLANQYSGNKTRFANLITRSIAPIADAVERLAPGLANGGENAEYPWIDSRGILHTPCNHTFGCLSQQLVHSPGRNVLKLLHHALHDPDFHRASGI